MKLTITCFIDINDCKRDSCLNGGQCVDLVNAFKCKCKPGFTGSRCEKKSTFTNEYIYKYLICSHDLTFDAVIFKLFNVHSARKKA